MKVEMILKSGILAINPMFFLNIVICMDIYTDACI